MVNTFRWAAGPDIRFGLGQRQQLPALMSAFGERVLILCGQSFANSDYWTELQNQMVETGLQWQQHTISSEPSPAMIDSCVEAYRSWSPQIVVAIGGGSVLDAGKAVAAMLTEVEGVKTFLEGVGSREPSGTTLPFIALPTTSGTGSEATKNAVLAEIGPQGYKKSLRHDAYVPAIALLDPALCVSAPANVTARSGMDAFTQLLEAYLSPAASPMSDALALDGLRLIRDCLLPACEDGENLNARSGMSYAALLSGLCLANAGLGLVHGFASSVGGRFAIPHGLLCGRLMAPANRITLAALRERSAWSEGLEKYVRVGKLFHPNRSYKPDAWYADAFVQTLEHWTDKLALQSLQTFGVEEADISEIVRQTGQKNHPIRLRTEEVEQVLRAGL